jgi:hypothetical protein
MMTSSYLIQRDPAHPTMYRVVLDGKQICGSISRILTAEQIAQGHFSGLVRAMGLKAGTDAQMEIKLR